MQQLMYAQRLLMQSRKNWSKQQTTKWGHNMQSRSAPLLIRCLTRKHQYRRNMELCSNQTECKMWNIFLNAPLDQLLKNTHHKEPFKWTWSSSSLLHNFLSRKWLVVADYNRSATRKYWQQASTFQDRKALKREKFDPTVGPGPYHQELGWSNQNRTNQLILAETRTYPMR